MPFPASKLIPRENAFPSLDSASKPIPHEKQKARPLSGSGFLRKTAKKLLRFGLVPDFLGDESGQVAAVFGHCLEGKTLGGSFAVALEIGDFGGNFLAELDIVERMLHLFLLLGFFCMGFDTR